MFSFRRITSSGTFIPEIDGLRFVAIASVVMHHLTTFIHAKDIHIYRDNTDYSVLKDLGWKGFFGVELFFVISGFVLALPFARMHFKLAEPVNIRNYFLRRLTRLEPPYIIVMTGLLFASIYIAGKLQTGEALKSYVSSLFYAHNFIYGKGIHPLLNTVAWSLEIEVQFYLLAPLLCYLFAIRNVFARRALLCVSVITFTCLNPWLPFRFISLANYIQYFLTGLMLADFYLTKPVLPRTRNVSSEMLGVILLVGMWIWNARAIESKTASMLWQLLQLVMVFGFYYLVLIAGRCSWIRATLVTAIGGMCYTIYLIHYPLISLAGNVLVKISFSSYSFINLGIILLLLVTLILVCSGVFYLLIERPCMDQHWPKKLRAKLRQLL
jgi:peptidoglycan/LPS O-acetylase OafA/YrhL